MAQFPMRPSPDMRVWECRRLYCVHVPRQNTWADYASNGCYYNAAERWNHSKLYIEDTIGQIKLPGVKIQMDSKGTCTKKATTGVKIQMDSKGTCTKKATTGPPLSVQNLCSKGVHMDSVSISYFGMKWDDVVRSSVNTERKMSQLLLYLHSAYEWEHVVLRSRSVKSYARRTTGTYGHTLFIQPDDRCRGL
nr:mini-chromosome maintenance complex-binding protein [Tanacetum cinerariifolium]